MSYDALKDFHAKHYHPSNSKFYTYGNFPLEGHLEAIDKVICSFDANPLLSKLSVVPNQQHWSKPVHEKLVCQFDPLAPYVDKQTTLGVAFLLKSITDTHENFTLSILCSLLIDGPSSPFYETLLNSSFGSDYSPFSGYHKFTKQTLFSIGVQGIAKNQVSSVLKAIKMTFKDAYDEGFPRERVDAILHRIELGIKHQNSSFGLGLAMNINSYWNHDVDPIECLQVCYVLMIYKCNNNLILNSQVNKHLEHFKQSLESDPKFLQKKVKQYFLDNPHQLIIEMSPFEKYEQKLQEAEKQLLDEKIGSLTDSNRSNIIENGKLLLNAQDAQEDVSILPTLTVKDISRSFKKTTIEKVNIEGVPVQYSAQPTNGIVYFNGVIQLKGETFPKKLIPYLPLFTHVLTKLGAGPWDKKKLDQEIQVGKNYRCDD